MLRINEMRVTDQTRWMGALIGSVMSIELYINSDAFKVDVGYWYELVLLKIIYLFRPLSG